MSNLRLRICGYKAIKKADIELADLTVLSGVNASGKSTIASLFHAAVETHRNRHYYSEVQALLDNQTYRKIKWVVSLLDDLGVSIPEKVKAWDLDFLSRKYSLEQNVTGMVCDFLLKALADSSLQAKVLACPQCLESFNRSSGIMAQTVEEVINWFVTVCAQYQKLYTEITTGPTYHGMFWYGLLMHGHFQGMNGVLLPGELKIFNGDSLVYDWINKNVPPPILTTPKRALYIDNPSVTAPVKVSDKYVCIKDSYYPIRDSMESMRVSEWKRLLFDAVHGGLERPEEGVQCKSQWAFRQQGVDGQIDFAKCAEGIKSIMGLDLLDKYGLLDADSLVIIDEPEVHLHPQWVVECARVLIALVQEVKARVLIATHSPYLVQAIKNLSVGKLTEDQVKFYLADKKPEELTFTFRDLKGNIGPIFESFNVALDEVAVYED